MLWKQYSDFLLEKKPHSSIPSVSYLELHVHKVVCNDLGILPRLLHTTHVRWLYKYDIGLQFLGSSYLNTLHRKIKCTFKNRSLNFLELT